MKAKYSFTPGSLAHCGSIVSLTLLDEIRPTALSRPAGSRNEIDDAEVGTKNRSGFQLISATPLIICEVNLPSTTPNITLGARRLQRRNLRADGRRAGLVGCFRDDHGRGLVSQAALEAGDVIAAEIVVLGEDGDPGVRLGPQDMLGIDNPFGLVGRHSRHGPAEILWVGPFGRAAEHEELRHLLAIEVAMHRIVGGGPERAE